MKKLLALVVTLAVLAPLSACNTMQGLGKDIQKAGDKLEDAAKK